MPDRAVLRGLLAEPRRGNTVETFTILTTKANHAMCALQQRHSVILAPDAFELRLAREYVRHGPAPEDPLSMHPVGHHAYDRRADESDCAAVDAVA